MVIFCIILNKEYGLRSIIFRLERKFFQQVNAKGISTDDLEEEMLYISFKMEEKTVEEAVAEYLLSKS